MFANLFVSAGLAYVSHHNYPGGKAMEALHEVHQSLVGAEAVGNQTGKLVQHTCQAMLKISQSAYSFRRVHG
jgi:hypothetical protein